MKKIFAIAALFVASVAGTAIAADAPANSDLKVTAPATVKTGEAVSATISVTTKNGYHINKEYPWKLTVGEKKLDKFSLAETKATLAGAPKGKATLKGAVCSGATCKPFTKEIEVP